MCYAMAGICDPLTDLPPPSRLDLDDLNAFASLPAPPLPPLLAWSPWIPPLFSAPQGKLPVNVFLLAFSRSGCHVLHHLPNKKLIGSVVLPQVSMANNTLCPSLHDQACYLYALDDRASVVVAVIQYSVPPELAYSWVKLVFGAIQPENVHVLGHLKSDHFRGRLSADDVLLYRLETDQLRLSKSQDSLPIPYLPSGSLVDGIGAAILTHCQLRGLPARLLLTWPDSDGSVVSLLASTLEFLWQEFPNVEALDLSNAKKIPFRQMSVADLELYA